MDMSDSFQNEIKIEFSPQITIGDISGNIGLSSLVLIFMFFIALFVLAIKKL